MFISTSNTSVQAVTDGLRQSSPKNAFRNLSAVDLRNLAFNRAHILTEAKASVPEFFDTNTLDAELQRTVILNDLVRAYAVRIIALQAFSTVFRSTPLEGTDKIDMPFFPLQTAASTDFVAGTGYTFGNTAQSFRQITVNKRKYQGMAFTSYEYQRQPYLNLKQLAVMNAQKLAVDVFTDILTNNITAANYGASVKAVPSLAFTSSDIADLYATATTLNWPDTGRSLVLDQSYKVNLLKDPAFRQYLSYGSTEPIRNAAIQEAYGFQDIFVIPNLATTYSPAGQNLVGWINHKAALLVGFSPIRPTPAVMAMLADYQIAVDPDSGIAIEYRKWGTPQMDQQNEIVESNYGAGKGLDTALARITSQ